MKKGIHPEYMEARVTCACGANFTTRATQEEIHVDICSVCHPFYTGKQRLVDTAGRVERFKRKYANVGADESADESADAATEDTAPGTATAVAEPPAEEPVAADEATQEEE